MPHIGSFMRILEKITPRSFPDPRYGTLLTVFITLILLFVGFLPLLRGTNILDQLEDEKNTAQRTLLNKYKGTLVHSLQTPILAVPGSWALVYTQHGTVNGFCKEDQQNVPSPLSPTNSSGSTNTLPPPPHVLNADETGSGIDKGCTITDLYIGWSPTRIVIRWD